MRLSRKILRPSLIWLAFLVLVLVVIVGVGIAGQNRVQERKDLTHLEDAFQSEMQHLTDSALGIAASIAGNPEVQDALLQEDKEHLLALVRPSYEQTLSALPINGMTFFTPNGNFFLSALQQTAGEARFQATPSVIVQEALSTRRAASGLLLTSNGVNIHAAMPILQGNTLAGVVEVTLQVGARALQDIKKHFDSDLQILLVREEDSAAKTRIINFSGPLPALGGYVSTLPAPLFGSETAYQSALEGVPQISYAQSLQIWRVIRSVPLRDAEENIIGVVDFVMDRSQATRMQSQRLAFSLGSLIVALLFGGGGMLYFTNRSLEPLRELSAAAEDILSGNTARQVEVVSDDELGLLARALNAFSRHLQALSNTLERRVQERTQELERRTMYLQSAAEIARVSTTLTDLDTLLDRVAALINDRFRLYHTSIFLRDSAGERVVLRAAAGHNRDAILSQNITLKIGSGGAIGRVVSTGEAYLVTDTSADPYYIPNELLPDTRSEIIVPLRVGDRILGALNIESDTTADDLANEMQILQILADQIAVAIENARLLEENRASLAASRRLHGELSRADWSRLLSARLLGYESTPTGIRPLSEGASAPSASGTNSKEVPLEAHGKVIGSLYAEKHPQERWLTDEDIILREVAQQISLVLESARLLDNLQERSRQEAIINQVADAMGQTLDVDLMLQNILQEMGENMDFEMLEIRLGNPDSTIHTPAETIQPPAEG